MVESQCEIAAAEDAELASVARLRARAEWVELDAMVRAARRQHALIDEDPSYFHRMVHHAGVALTIGQSVGLSEKQAAGRIAWAEITIERTPGFWAAFSEGHVDAARQREVAQAVAKLVDPQSWRRLDERATAYAPTHTVSELRSWLKRLIARLEPEQFIAAATGHHVLKWLLPNGREEPAA